MAVIAASLVTAASLCTSFTQTRFSGEKQEDDYSNACNSTLYFGWNKTIIFLHSIDQSDFPFSAQDLNSLTFF